MCEDWDPNNQSSKIDKSEKHDKLDGEIDENKNKINFDI